MDCAMQQKILSRSVIGAGKFLVLKDLSFQDDRGAPPPLGSRGP